MSMAFLIHVGTFRVNFAVMFKAFVCGHSNYIHSAGFNAMKMKLVLREIDVFLGSIRASRASIFTIRLLRFQQIVFFYLNAYSRV